ncbi:MAG: T9SS type A sorting domain-containing protein [Bacteroidales bacterium]
MRKYFLIVLLVFSISFASKSYAQPVISMVTASDTVTYWGARMIAMVTTKDSWPVNSYGFIFDTLPMPTRATGAKILRVGTTSCPENATYTGTVSNASSYMASDKTYYVRAYVAKTSGGNDTVFSDQMTLMTLAPEPPICSIDSIYAVTLTSARFGGTAVAKKDANIVSARGFIYSYLEYNPTHANATILTAGNNVSVFPTPYNALANNLTSGNKYYLRTYLIYKYLNKTSNDTVYSDTISFKTLHPCGSIPTNVEVDSITQTTARITFTRGYAQNKWEVDYGFAGHLTGTGTSLITTKDTVDLAGLIGGTSYTVFVRAVCTDSIYGDWTEVYPFTTVPPPCAPVGNISVSDFAHSSVTIEWWPGASWQNRWEILFTKSSSPFPNQGIIKEGDPVFFPIGLSPRTEYKLQIRALCPEHTSDWSAIYYFNTLPQGLQDEIDEIAEKVIIYPNPTNGTINFKAQDKQSIIKVEIYTSLGGLIYSSDNLPDSFTLTNQKNGIYLVKIYSKNHVQVEKVILN